jgi:Right handed beta helix region
MHTTPTQRRLALAGLTGAAALAAAALVPHGSSGGTSRTARPAAAKRTMIVCGATITVSTTVTNDLSNCALNGLNVVGSHITVNLAGHTIDGVANGDGVRVTGTGVTLENGIVTDFDVAVELDAAGGHVQGIHASGSGIGIRDKAGNDVITGNFVADNGSAGIVEDGTPHAQVTNNWARGNGSQGILAEGAGAAVTGNRALSNSGVGIATGSDPGILVAGNVANGNGTNGIATSGRTTLKNNTTSFNTGLGISATAFDTDGGGDKAAGNGSQHQCTNVVCS